MEEKTCEHEMNLVDEYWISNNTVRITLKCEKCKAGFEGIVFELEAEQTNPEVIEDGYSKWEKQMLEENDDREK